MTDTRTEAGADAATDSVHLRRGAYHDSVTLMQVSARVKAARGVSDALIGMGTELNLRLMRDSGFDVDPEAGPNDLVIALRGADDDAIAAGEALLEQVLEDLHARSRQQGQQQEVRPRTIGSAARDTGADIAFVSTPGAHAVLDAWDAIHAGTSVMLFSDNVSVADEIALKDAAAAADVLVMGPDCGTAVIGGAALGFANVVRQGRLGIIAASGTGAQQVMSLLDLAGAGISCCLGLGGRDLSAAVGGRSARQALLALAADEHTDHVVIVSKPADPGVVADLEALAADLGVAISWATLGRGLPDLTAATETALAAAGASAPPQWPRWGICPPTSVTGDLRGLVCGGTLADEAMIIAEQSLGPIASNIPLEGADTAEFTYGLGHMGGHTVIDFGSDELTQGRAHPMIDPSVRLEAIRAQGADPTCGVLLLDLVLGHGSHPRPAADLAAAIADARRTASEGGRELPVLVALVGTDSDPQGLQECARTLTDAGAGVFASNAEATRAALAHLTGRRKEQP